MISPTCLIRFIQEIYLNGTKYVFLIHHVVLISNCHMNIMGGGNAMAQSNRIVWIDWMKAIAMYFIIAGHCWVPYNQYIYVFSVPCFFIISGYFSHKESTASVFWAKLLFNMVIPLCIYLIIGLCFYNLQMYVNGLFNLNNLYQGPILFIIGMQGQNYSAGGLQALWFVYTLCICKIIFQFLPTT